VNLSFTVLSAIFYFLISKFSYGSIPGFDSRKANQLWICKLPSVVNLFYENPGGFEKYMSPPKDLTDPKVVPEIRTLSCSH